MLTAVKEQQIVAIRPPNLQTAEFAIEGTAPYVQHRFWKKAELMHKHQEGGRSKNKKNRDPRDFNKEYEEAMYRSAEGWHGIPAPAFRAALVSACRLVNFKMTLAKLSIFVLADGIDPRDSTPLIRIEGTPQKLESIVRNETGVVDIRARAVWNTWKAKIRVRYDADQFSIDDVSNLLQRVGMQVGIGEGRPDSKQSCGLGFGTFEVK